jgi:hypothetical protein
MSAIVESGSRLLSSKLKLPSWGSFRHCSVETEAPHALTVHLQLV